LITHAGLVSFGMILAHRERRQEKLQATDYKNNAEKILKSSTLQKQMVALVSHEFRNSLSILNVSMHAIKNRNDVPAEVMERHRNIVLVHRQMRKVIDNFLLEERIQNANISISYQRTNMNVLIEEVISLAELIGKDHFISSDLDNLPDPLWLDEGILRLILTNLIDNAVKYSAPGSKVSIHGRSENGLLYMSVTDNGIGMTTDSLSHLFEPHFKADLTSEGIGIGLYMVRMMLHAHDGDLRVTSEIGTGSVLEFWLKAQLDDQIFFGDLNDGRSDFQRRNSKVAHLPNYIQK
jgi:signal transduction histidine kinase